MSEPVSTEPALSEQPALAPSVSTESAPAEPSSTSEPPASSTTPAATSSSPASSSSSSYNPPQPPVVSKHPTRVYSTHPPSWTKQPSSKSRELLLEMFKDPSGKPVLETLKCGKKSVHSFGRNSEQCTHTCDHSTISRQHAAIMHNANAAYIVDLHSSHGTTLNNTKLVPGEPHILRNGDVIQLGQWHRKFRVRGLRYDGSNKRSASDVDSKDGSSNKRPKNEIQASHILIKHAGSRRPGSHREANITRTRDEAAEVLKGLQQQLNEAAAKSPEELRRVFSNLANDYSDCSSFKRGGDLGKFTAEKMQAEFSQAAFALGVNELSQIVDSQSGVHLILRTG